MAQASPRVFLVGAGPGHPGLLTLRAAECLKDADLVIYDRLVPKVLLGPVRPGVPCVCVGDLPGSTQPERWPHVHQLMIEAARTGRRVVRLKGGDPFIFGRGGEEAEALRAAGIAYEIVPGITAALGAAAHAGIPLTHRDHASAVAFVTGHENPAKPGSALDWDALARFPGTLVFYMGLARLPEIAAELLRSGKPAATPAAVVERASTPRQRTVEGTLATIADAVKAAGLQAPSLTVIGAVVAMRSELSWYDRGPLFGKGVLVTRPRHQAGALCQALYERGALPILVPAVEIKPPEQWDAVDRAIDKLAEFHWLVFTSVNGVQQFLERLRARGRDLRALGSLRLAAIGPATAAALGQYHLEPDLVPDVYQSEALAEALRPLVQGRRVLLARADRGRDVLRDELSRVANVEQVAVYRQVDAVDPTAEGLEALRHGDIDYATFTSSNIARAVLNSLDESALAVLRSGRTRIVCISPVTGDAVRERGLPVAAEAGDYTTAGLLEALERAAVGDG